MKKILTILALITCIGAEAQNINNHYLYQLNWYNINPALSAKTEGINLMANSGINVLGVSGSPVNSMFSVRVPYENMGVGAKVVSNQVGNFKNLSAEFTYGYKLKFSNVNHDLYFGVGGGMYQSNLNTNDAVNNSFTDLSDPSLTYANYNSTKFLASLGAFYKFKDFEFAASLPHVMGLKDNGGHTFVMARYVYKQYNKSDFAFIPHVVYQNIPISPAIIDLGFKTEWKSLMWLQATYRTNQTTMLGAGVSVNSISVGYMYGMTQGDLALVSKGTHQLVLSIDIDKKGRRKKMNSDAQQPTMIKFEVSGDEAKEKAKIREEVKAMLIELTELVKKQKDGTITAEEEKKLQELSLRVKELKKKMEE